MKISWAWWQAPMPYPGFYIAELLLITKTRRFPGGEAPQVTSMAVLPAPRHGSCPYKIKKRTETGSQARRVLGKNSAMNLSAAVSAGAVGRHTGNHRSQRLFNRRLEHLGESRPFN
ncbi:hypothetical protein AAY473_030489 [Plecturocebus cupreus]